MLREVAVSIFLLKTSILESFEISLPGRGTPIAICHFLKPVKEFNKVNPPKEMKMRKKFFSASILAVILLVLSGSGVRSTYSAASMIAPDACQSACVDEMSACIASGQPQKRCLGQYHQCNNQCRK